MSLMITTGNAGALERELGSGEKLLWSGQPRRGICFRSSDYFVVPFSVIWCGFAIFWESLVIIKKAPVFMAFWGIPFILVGLYFVFGRFFVDAMGRAKTFYGVTNERVLIISGLFSRETRSLNLRTLSDVSLRERPDKTGTISFGPNHPMGLWMPPGVWPGMGRYAPPAFEMIENAKTIYELIRQAQKSAA